MLVPTRWWSAPMGGTEQDVCGAGGRGTALSCSPGGVGLAEGRKEMQKGLGNKPVPLHCSCYRHRCRCLCAPAPSLGGFDDGDPVSPSSLGHPGPSPGALISQCRARGWPLSHRDGPHAPWWQRGSVPGEPHPAFRTLPCMAAVGQSSGDADVPAGSFPCSLMISLPLQPTSTQPAPGCGLAVIAAPPFALLSQQKA